MACAPFYYVGFADFWLADQLNSLVTVLLDAHYLICFYIYNDNWYQTSGKPKFVFKILLLDWFVLIVYTVNFRC